MLKKLIYILLLIFLFLLPWQTRYIFAPAFLNGGWWEYGAGSFYATEILLWLIIILSFIDILRNKELLKKIFSKEHFQAHKCRLFVVLSAIGYALFAITTSLSPSISFNWMFHLLEGACLAVVIIFYSKSNNCHPRVGGDPGRQYVPALDSRFRGNDSEKLFLVLWLSGVVQGMLAIWQFFSQSVFASKWLGMAVQSASQFGSGVIETGGERWLRAYGSLGGPNPLGAYLAVMWILGFLIIPLLKGEGRVRSRVVVTIGQLIILSGLILSFSRGGWLAAGVGLVVLVALSRGGMTSPLRDIGKQLLLSLIVVLLFIFALLPLFTARVTAIGRLEEQSIYVRSQQYNDYDQIFSKNWLVGVGPGAYTLALYQLDSYRPSWHYQPIHNTYLIALAEIGVVGCLLVILLNCYIVKLLAKRNPVFLSVIVALLVTALFEHWWWSLYVGMVGWGAVVGAGLVKLDSGVESDKID